MTPYSIYIVRCRDNTLYTGVTTDIERRIFEHNNTDKGAKYTRIRRPVELVYHETCSSRSEAQRREYEIKHMTKGEKEKLTLSQYH